MPLNLWTTELPTYLSNESLSHLTNYRHQTSGSLIHWLTELLSLEPMNHCPTGNSSTNKDAKIYPNNLILNQLDDSFWRGQAQTCCFCRPSSGSCQELFVHQDPVLVCRISENMNLVLVLCNSERRTKKRHSGTSSSRVKERKRETWKRREEKEEEESVNKKPTGKQIKVWCMTGATRSQEGTLWNEQEVAGNRRK